MLFKINFDYLQISLLFFLLHIFLQPQVLAWRKQNKSFLFFLICLTFELNAKQMNKKDQEWNSKNLIMWVALKMTSFL